jgi:hypothetical protein
MNLQSIHINVETSHLITSQTKRSKNGEKCRGRMDESFCPKQSMILPNETFQSPKNCQPNDLRSSKFFFKFSNEKASECLLTIFCKDLGPML